MISAMIKNTPVIRMYRDEKHPYIETVITIRSPFERGDELHQKLSSRIALITPIMEELNKEVEEKIQDTFEADVVSIYSGVRNL